MAKKPMVPRVSKIVITVATGSSTGQNVKKDAPPVSSDEKDKSYDFKARRTSYYSKMTTKAMQLASISNPARACPPATAAVNINASNQMDQAFRPTTPPVLTKDEIVAKGCPSPSSTQELVDAEEVLSP